MEYTWGFIKISVALLSIVFLFYLTVKFIKEKKIFNQTNEIKILERIYLSSNQTIYLLQVVEEIWIVTATKEEIEFVKELDVKPEDIKESTTETKSILNYFRKGIDSKHEE
jgi:flagellar biogenesis protein FliO